jgi:hypothetical protein
MYLGDMLPEYEGCHFGDMLLRLALLLLPGVLSSVVLGLFSAGLLGEPIGFEAAIGDEAESGVLLLLLLPLLAPSSSEDSIAVELFDLCGILKLLNVLKPKPRLEARLGDWSGGVFGLALDEAERRGVDVGLTKLARI